MRFRTCTLFSACVAGNTWRQKNYFSPQGMALAVARAFVFVRILSGEPKGHCIVICLDDALLNKVKSGPLEAQMVNMVYETMDANVVSCIYSLFVICP